MSANTLEKALWHLNVDRESKRAFKDDPTKFLARFHLTDKEREMILAFDVRALADSGVNTMLTMGFWLELEGSHNLNGYLVRMNAREPMVRARLHG